MLGPLITRIGAIFDSSDVWVKILVIVIIFGAGFWVDRVIRNTEGDND